MSTDIRNLEITSQHKDLVEPNVEIWEDLGIKQSDGVLFFPTPNVLVPIAFAKFMKKRKVTFADASEINVSTLISLAADLRLSNVTVKLVARSGKFPLPDDSFDKIFSDWGYSALSQAGLAIDPNALTKELVRMLKPGGTLAALDENGPPIMFPCPPEVLAVKAKVDALRADRYGSGRRVYALFKSNGLKNVRLRGYSRFLTKDEAGESLVAEITRRIQALDALRDSSSSRPTLNAQELEKYRQWLKAQALSDTFVMQFNSILTTGQK
jgi:SAM-dependent methyltransferase